VEEGMSGRRKWSNRVAWKMEIGSNNHLIEDVDYSSSASSKKSPAPSLDYALSVFTQIPGQARQPYFQQAPAPVVAWGRAREDPSGVREADEGRTWCGQVQLSAIAEGGVEGFGVGTGDGGLQRWNRGWRFTGLPRSWVWTRTHLCRLVWLGCMLRVGGLWRRDWCSIKCLTGMLLRGALYMVDGYGY
jgi:hypothetical protein